MKARSPQNGPKNPDERAAALLQSRNLKMARSAHAYVRGSTAKFYEWLESAEGRTAPAGPAIWICGDCHVGNLGPVANADGKVAIQIRDLDQTVIGNPVHDLIRLGLSLATAARGSEPTRRFKSKRLRRQKRRTEISARPCSWSTTNPRCAC